MQTLYVHIPFCEKKCFYCSFVVSVGHQHKIDSYLEALFGEMKNYEKSDIASLYIGGGTPSLLKEYQLEKLFTEIKNKFKITRDAEVTIETNPEDITQSKLRRLKALGVNRLSLGAQSFDEKYLRYLGRNHDSGAIKEAYKKVKEAGFANLSMDLMFAFSDQTKEEILKDINQISSFDIQHLSLYGLNIEPNSRFYARNIAVPNDRLQSQYYRVVCDEISKYGFKQYEVSNFSKKGFESKHNLHYWNGGNYIGLGVGAHSHMDGLRYWNTANMFDYIKSIKQNKSATSGQEKLSNEARAVETFLIGLRMNQGVQLKEIEKRFDYVFDERRIRIIDDLRSSQHLVDDGVYLRVSEKGRSVLDEISVRII